MVSSSLSTAKSDIPIPVFSASGTLGLFYRPAVQAMMLTPFILATGINFAGTVYLKILMYFCFSVPPRF